MNIVFDEGFAKVWSDERSPIVFANVRQMPLSKVGFFELCERHIELIRQIRKRFERVYSITDLSGCSPFPLGIAFDYAQSFIPRQFRAGVQFKAFIKPRNLVSRTTLDTVLRVTDNPGIGVYESFEGALQDINQKMDGRDFERRASIRSNISDIISTIVPR